MNQWLNLTKKEIRLGLPAFLIPIIVFIIVTSIAYYIGYRNGVGIISIIGVSSLAIMAQVFYLPYFMFYSLATERKTLHLWLHSPLSGAALLTAKMTAGLIAMIPTLLITGATALIAFSLKSDLIAEIGITLPNMFKPLVFGGVHLILFSISLSIGFIFFWMIFLMFTRFIGTFISFVATFAVAIVMGSIYGWLSDTRLYEAITNWGEFKLVGLLTDFEFSIDGNMEQTNIVTNVNDVSLYVGSYVFEVLLALILFYAACWILNRKVEV